MNAFGNGMERTLAQYVDLLAPTGWKIVSSRQFIDGYSMMEAIPAPVQ
jgi:hypothetical protein